MRFFSALLLVWSVTVAAGDANNADAPKENYDPEEPNWHKNAPRAPGNEAPPGSQSIGTFKTPQATDEEKDSVVLPKHMHCDGDDTAQLCVSRRQHVLHITAGAVWSRWQRLPCHTCVAAGRRAP